MKYTAPQKFVYTYRGTPKRYLSLYHAGLSLLKRLTRSGRERYGYKARVNNLQCNVVVKSLGKYLPYL